MDMSQNTFGKYVCELEERQFIYTESTTVIIRNVLKRNDNLLCTIRPAQLERNQFDEQL